MFSVSFLRSYEFVSSCPTLKEVINVSVSFNSNVRIFIGIFFSDCSSTTSHLSSTLSIQTKQFISFVYSLSLTNISLSILHDVISVFILILSLLFKSFSLFQVHTFEKSWFQLFLAVIMEIVLFYGCTRSMILASLGESISSILKFSWLPYIHGFSKWNFSSKRNPQLFCLNDDESVLY